METFLGYRLNDRFSFEGGFNYIKENADRTVFQGQYHLLHLILGVNYHVTPQTKLYLMTRFTSGNNAEYINNVNAFAFGFKYDFNFGWKRTELLK
jgi:hypothetical protein